MHPLLLEEHELLGAHIVRSGEEARVTHYGDGAGESAALTEGVGLIDLGGLSSWRAWGTPAPLFSQTAFAGRPLSIGECSFEPVLLGDGSLASIPLLARTGDAEYVCWDGTGRAAVLGGWLTFLSSIEQGGQAPFEGLSLDEVSESLAPLALWGPRARTVLSDYLEPGAAIPERGTLRDLMLDRISALVGAVPLNGDECLLLLVPPQRVRILWRSLLSFPVVTPVGEKALGERALACLPWLARVAHESDRLEVSASELSAAGLIRGDRSFVGARGLDD